MLATKYELLQRRVEALVSRLLLPGLPDGLFDVLAGPFPVIDPAQ
jgi:hypothetical protein